MRKCTLEEGRELHKTHSTCSWRSKTRAQALIFILFFTSGRELKFQYYITESSQSIIGFGFKFLLSYFIFIHYLFIYFCVDGMDQRSYGLDMLRPSFFLLLHCGTELNLLSLSLSLSLIFLALFLCFVQLSACLLEIPLHLELGAPIPCLFPAR